MNFNALSPKQRLSLEEWQKSEPFRLEPAIKSAVSIIIKQTNVGSIPNIANADIAQAKLEVKSLGEVSHYTASTLLNVFQMWISNNSKGLTDKLIASKLGIEEDQIVDVLTQQNESVVRWNKLLEAKVNEIIALEDENNKIFRPVITDPDTIWQGVLMDVLIDGDEHNIIQGYFVRSSLTELKLEFISIGGFKYGLDAVGDKIENVVTHRRLAEIK